MILACLEKIRLEGVVTQGKGKNYWSINYNIGIKAIGPMLLKDKRSLIMGIFSFSDIPRQRQRTQQKCKTAIW